MAAYTYKGSQIVTPFTIFSNQPVYEVQTVSLKTQRASQNVQRWEISFTTVDVDQTAEDMLVGLSENLDQVETMVMPQLPSSFNRTIVNSSVRSNATQASGLTTVVVNSSSNGLGDVIAKGSFITFANHDKMYIVTSDCDLSGSTANLNIFPALRQDLTNTTGVNIKDQVSFKHFRSIDTMTGITFNDGVLSSPGTITLIEAI